MAVRIIRENNRSEGRKKVTAAPDIIAGQPLLLAANKETKAYDDTSHVAFPYGIAAESTEQLPIAPASGQTVGEGFDYTNFNRGGLVGAFVNGSELELFDDGRGKPFDDSVTYALNDKAFAGDNGLVTNDDDSAAANKIGSIVDFDVANGTKRLRVKFDI